jgi:hypothetical protein
VNRAISVLTEARSPAGAARLLEPRIDRLPDSKPAEPSRGISGHTMSCVDDASRVTLNGCAVGGLRRRDPRRKESCRSGPPASRASRQLRCLPSISVLTVGMRCHISSSTTLASSAVSLRSMISRDLFGLL